MVKCPICGANYDRHNRQRRKTWINDIQHHLYMAHNVAVIESHKMARDIAKGKAITVRALGKAEA